MKQSHDSIIAREGIVFILVFAFFTLSAFFIASLWAALLLLLLTLFTVWFFRNPERKTPPGEKLVVSPADGKVILIEEVHDHELMAGPWWKISIFMNVFNVHVNRVPCTGRIEAIRYHT
jgi:phosphatidylserine decarboxylase